MNPRVLAMACAVLVALAVTGCERAQKREPLRELYTPSFAPIPPQMDAGEAAKVLRQEWRRGGRDALIADVRSAQGIGVLAALAVILIIAWPGRSSGATLPDLLLLLAAGLPLFGVMRFFDHLREPAYLRLLDAVFTAVVVLGVALVIRATVLALGTGPGLRSRVPASLLALIVLGTVAANVVVALQRPPDDAGWFVNLGAQRLRERGLLPYGDPLTTGTPAAAYGPLMYVAHLPFQLALAPATINPGAPDRPELGERSSYYLPPMLATKLTAIAFQLLAVVSLFAIGRRWADSRTALALVALYASSVAVLGIGGTEYSVAGITFISHIAPAAMTLVALATIARPALAGTALVGAAGLGFYPALLGPVWLGYYWRDRVARRRFVLGCGISATLLVLFVIGLSRPADGRSRIQTIMADTLGHHTDPAGYGMSPFGFWGQRPGWRDWFIDPLAGTSSLTSPAYLLLLGYVVFAAFAARGRSLSAVALLGGAIALGFALIKPHASGTYLAWYYPLLLVGICLPRFTSKPDQV